MLTMMMSSLMIIIGCDEAPSTEGPSTEDFAKQREALKARVASSGQKAAAKSTTAKPAAPAVPSASADDLAPSFAGVIGEYTYDRTGKRDPFRNFSWERPDRLRDVDLTGPLEQFDLNQLDLVAVVWKTGNSRALVEDPAGESYIVGEGARIGRNEGYVIAIEDDLVVVKETYVDHLGQETTKDIEMRMRRNEGG
jgi:hypothetical protein